MRDGEEVPLVKGKPTEEARMSAATGNSAGATAIQPFTISTVPEAELKALRAHRGYSLAPQGDRHG
jgi:hypothetical protein